MGVWINEGAVSENGCLEDKNIRLKNSGINSTLTDLYTFYCQQISSIPIPRYSRYHIHHPNIEGINLALNKSGAEFLA